MFRLLIPTVLCSAIPAVAQVTFINVGVAPGVGSRTFGLSSNGQVAVGVRVDGGGASPPGVAYQWTLGAGSVPLPSDPAYSVSTARAVSPDGSCIVGFVSTGAGPSIAARWNGGGPQLLGALPSHTSSFATNTSADGTIVAGTSGQNAATGPRAFRWTAGAGMQDLGILPGYTGSFTGGMSDDGSVIAGGMNFAPASPHAFRWTTGAGWQPLGLLPNQSTSVARGISPNGALIVGSSGDKAFRWTATGGMSELVVFSSFGSSANVTNGLLVGGTYRSTITGEDRAVLWNGFGEPIDFGNALGGNLPAAWTLNTLTGISADGTVFCGTGTHNGIIEGWVVIIPPPGTLVLFTLAVIPRRRRVACLNC